jgi:O-antigen/teichoic acid export membrane protein
MLQRITKELKQGKKLVTYTFLLGLGRTLGMAAPLVVAKALSPQMFGSYSLAIMIVFFFSMLLTVSPQTPFIVFASREKSESGKINKAFSVQLTLLMLSLLIFVGITFALHNVITSFAKIESVDLFFIFLAFAGISLKTFLCSLFMALGHRIRNSIAEFVFGLLVLAFVGALYATDRVALQTVLMAYPTAGAILIAAFVATINFKTLRPFALERKYFTEMLGFTKWVFLGATAVYFINWGDNLVLRFFVSMESIGNYNLGYQIFKGIATLTIGVATYFLPFVSQHLHDADKMRNYLFNKMRKLFVLGTALIILVFVFAPYLFELFYQEAYPHATMILRVLLVGSVAIVYTSLYKPVFDALKEYRFTHAVNVVQVLLNLLMDVILVPSMGILGAAVATVAACIVKLIIYELFFRIRIVRLLKL